MKWLLVVINLIVLVNSISAIARQEKIIKKPHGLKPTKPPKTIIDEFRNLSSDDVEFIKQVDKQFKVHGDKIKIKFERENTTVVNKNSKRTIDDSLGYGFRQNQHQNGYYFSKPHYMHQFTSLDVLNEKGGYREKATDIEIQQSHSFELKEQEYTQSYQPSASQNYQHEQVYEDPVPVIVLRVPGPQKYALHLQALLQQYLEIRAASYIKALEEQERHGHLMHPQHYLAQQQQQQQHQQQQQMYLQMYAITPTYHEQQQHQHHQTQQQHYYQNLQHQQQQQHGYPHYYQHQVNHGAYSIPAGDQSYYSQPQSHQSVTPEYNHAPAHQPMPQEYATSYINFVTPSYDEGDLQHQNRHHQVIHEDSSLETSENYPSDKHTQVIFKKKKNRVRPTHSYQHSQPIVVPDPPAHQQEEEHYQQEQVAHQPETVSYDHNSYQVPEAQIVVTQRSKGPLNYHVLHPTLAPTPDEIHERHVPKRMAPFTKEQFEKAHRIMMSKAKRNRGSMRQEKAMEKPAEAAMTS